MTRQAARRVVERLALPVATEDARGPVLRRSGVVSHNLAAGRWSRSIWGVARTELWRLHCGGGIAGNSWAWWLSPLESYNGVPRGPFTTARALEKALRAWRRWE